MQDNNYCEKCRSVKVLAGFDLSNKVVAIESLEAWEIDGLVNISPQNFLNKFKDYTYLNLINTKEIDAITGATKSSIAVFNKLKIAAAMLTRQHDYETRSTISKHIFSKINGQETRLNSKTILCYFNTRDAESLKQLSELNELKEKYPQVQLYGISDENNKQLQKYYAQNKLKFELLFDQDHKFRNEMMINHSPTTLFVSNNKIVFRYAGRLQGSYNNLIMDCFTKNKKIPQFHITLKEGMPAPKIKAKTATGLQIDLQQNKPTLIYFFSIDCPSCKKITPKIFQLSQQMKDKINIIMVGQQGLSALNDYVQNQNKNIYVISDSDAIVDYQIKRLPSIVLVNKGVVVKVFSGSSEYDNQVVKKILNEKNKAHAKDGDFLMEEKE